MRFLTVGPEELEESREVQIRPLWGWPATSSCNEDGQVGPFTTLSLTPKEDRNFLDIDLLNRIVRIVVMETRAMGKWPRGGKFYNVTCTSPTGGLEPVRVHESACRTHPRNGMIRTGYLLLLFVLLALTAACDGLQEVATPAQNPAPETVYVNGHIYTQDKDLPWAESLVTKGERIVFVGSDQDALQYAGEDSKVIDLQGRFVMPGIIDAHTHPGLISVSGNLSNLDDTAGENEEPATPDKMPSRPREATLAWLQKYVDEHPFTFVISHAGWDVAAYLPDGPHKRDLDKISRIKPIILYDNSGHSVWVNSAMLRLLGIDRNTPDLSHNLSYIVRDDAEEPTGWLKEFVLTHYMGGRMVPGSR